MKRYIISILIVGIIACNSNPHKIATTDSVQYQQSFNANTLTDKRVIYRIADSIITNYKGKQYFSLTDFDTTDVFITEDYFTNNKTKTTLVLLGAEGNPSDGTAQNLLLLLPYTDICKVVSAEQSGTFMPLDIRDLNGDGSRKL